MKRDKSVKHVYVFEGILQACILLIDITEDLLSPCSISKIHISIKAKCDLINKNNYFEHRHILLCFIQ